MPRRSAHYPTYTKREVAALVHSGREGRDRYRDGGAPGLVINVFSDNSVTWTLRYTRATGGETETVLGAFPGLLPEDARALALKKRQEAKDGPGPVEVKRANKAEAERLKLNTMSALAEEYVTYIEREPKPGKNGKVRRKLRDATIEKNKQAIEFHLKPRLGSVPVEKLRRADVIKHAEELEIKNGHGAAHAFVAITRRLLNFAIDRDIIEFNCALRIELAQRESRERVTKPKELATLWKALEHTRRHRRGWMTATAIQVCMLTAKRRSEVAGITESEVDFDNMLWIIPGERSKNHKDDRVPLTPTTAALLREAFKRSDSETHAFVAKDYESPMEPETMTRMFARLRVDADIADLCLHDQRRTGATLMGQMGVDERTVSRILAHTPVGVAAVTGVYNRHDYLDEKREALLKWEARLAEIVAAKYDDEPKPNAPKKATQEASRARA